MINQIFYKLSFLRNRRKSICMKNDKIVIYPDDIFLVSYPRSGNTWMRFILANLFYPDKNINFTNIHQYCPEIDKLQDFSKKNELPRLIKTHDCFNPLFPKVIYIVRDGRDAYVSYYHYLGNTLPTKMTFKRFLEEGSMPYGRWSDHVLSWLNVNTPRLVIKYEEMFFDSMNTIRKVMGFINIEVDSKDIQLALEKSNFINMRATEKKHGRGKYQSGPNTFMRKGQIGDWKNYFGKDEKKIFKRKEKLVLVQLQYEKNLNW